MLIRSHGGAPVEREIDSRESARVSEPTAELMKFGDSSATVRRRFGDSSPTVRRESQI
jgi:hypothetical protein